jgi:methylmalonyl-CoA mutase N-terminal domain/subunit
MVAAIEKGYPQRAISEAAYSFQQQVDAGKRTVVGVNKYVTDHPPIETLKIDPEVERKQTARLGQVKAERDSVKVGQALEDLRRAAAGDENVMPYVIACVREYASLQEVCDVFRDVFGTYQDPGML